MKKRGKLWPNEGNYTSRLRVQPEGFNWVDLYFICDLRPFNTLEALWDHIERNR
jgi:hypothetical protein